MAAEGRIGEPQCFRLGGDHARVVDELLRAQRLDLLLEPGGGEAGKFQHRLDVDIAGVEEQPAAGRVGARLGMLVEQRMQRIKSDAGGAEIGREIDQPEEVGEIPVSPVAMRAHAVELHGERPQSRF